MERYIYTALLIAAGIAAASIVSKFFGLGTMTTVATS